MCERGGSGGRGKPRGAHQPPQPVRTPGPGGERGGAAAGGRAPARPELRGAPELPRGGGGSRGVVVPDRRQRPASAPHRGLAPRQPRVAPASCPPKRGEPSSSNLGSAYPGWGARRAPERAGFPSRPVPRVASSVCFRLFLTYRSARSCGEVCCLPQLGSW